ncbi:UPF0061 family protein [Pseudohyphozyma bogoriensis]|nr:UPF0061 family protein [Pseudohyphozyma bogoriensis]
MSTSASTTTKLPLHRLPISPSAPIYHLKPDPLTPTPAAFLSLSKYKPPEDAEGIVQVIKPGDAVPPSMARRSRALRDGAHFSYVSPLVLEFPYDIVQEGDEVKDKEPGEERTATMTTIETRLAEYEPSTEHPVRDDDATTPATLLSSPLRDTLPTPTLLSLSESCAAALLPQLDLGEPGSDTRARLVDLLGGKSVFANPGNGATDGDDLGERGFAPWSLCYGGHQFGSWAGQLGDGRAISILSTPAAPEVAERARAKSIELQLKGAGRTPFSRFADGLAVLRSSVREYLGAEAIAALGLPTSRALALVGIPSVRVVRERVETAAVVTRVASTWIRIGNFEIQASKKEWGSVARLSSFVGKEVFGFSEEGEEKKGSMALAVLREVAKRNAVMIAGWQAYGFVISFVEFLGHNMSVAGDCIDYGPYAFMDVFDPGHICNHSDGEGRYSYRNQPTMALFAITKLGNSLAELIGCEEELSEGANVGGYAAGDDDWAEGAGDAGWMMGWKETGEQKLAGVKKEFEKTFLDEYKRLMWLRLGLLSSEDADFDLVSSFLDLLHLYEMDYTNAWRRLSAFDGVNSPSYTTFVDDFLHTAPQTDAAPSDTSVNAKTNWKEWFTKYDERLGRESSRAAADSKSRKERMDAVNPRFTLRQWVLEEVIKDLENDKDGKGIAGLERVLRMAERPFEEYASGEEERLCGVGGKEMLGFQCSCSS